MALKKFFKKRLKLKIAVILLVLGAGAFSGFKYYTKKNAKPEAKTELAEVTRGNLERRFQEIGDITALNRVNVASKVGGRVIELAVKEGDRVKAGDKIAVIQPGKTGAERFLPSTLSAPIDGVVIGYVKNENSNSEAPKFVEVGDYVTGLFDSQNPTRLMTIADMRKVVVKLKINEMDILKLEENMPVDVTIDAIKEGKFPAVVHTISPRAQRERRGGKVFSVEVLLKRNHPKLRTGMTARVDALLEKRTNVLTIPLAALFEEKGTPYVFLDVPGGKPKQVAVETGMRTETDIEILGGLKEGDKLHNEKPVGFTAMKEKKKKKKKNGKLSKEQRKALRRKAKRARRAVRKAAR